MNSIFKSCISGICFDEESDQEVPQRQIVRKSPKRFDDIEIYGFANYALVKRSLRNVFLQNQQNKLDFTHECVPSKVIELIINRPSNPYLIVCPSFHSVNFLQSVLQANQQIWLVGTTNKPSQVEQATHQFQRVVQRVDILLGQPKFKQQIDLLLFDASQEYSQTDIQTSLKTYSKISKNIAIITRAEDYERFISSIVPFLPNIKLEMQQILIGGYSTYYIFYCGPASKANHVSENSIFITNLLADQRYSEKLNLQTEDLILKLRKQLQSYEVLKFIMQAKQKSKYETILHTFIIQLIDEEYVTFWGRGLLCQLNCPLQLDFVAKHNFQELWISTSKFWQSIQEQRDNLISK
ncbi:hypothetical protein pb186bvf_004354 [Paramecium bursaria]